MTVAASLSSRLLTVADVAEILQVSPRTVRRIIAAERLPVIRLGRAVRVHPAALAALMDGSGHEKTGGN